MTTLTLFVEMLQHIQTDVGAKDLEFEVCDPVNERSYYRITGKIDKENIGALNDAFGDFWELRRKNYAITGSLFEVEWFIQSEGNEFNM